MATKVANIYIMSEIQAALKAMEGHSLKSSLLLECRDSIQKLGVRNIVKLIWVLGSDNKAADELARKVAATHPSLGQSLSVVYLVL